MKRGAKVEQKDEKGGEEEMRREEITGEGRRGEEKGEEDQRRDGQRGERRKGSEKKGDN